MGVHAGICTGINTLSNPLPHGANYDKICLAETRVIYPKQTHEPTGKMLWHDSEAARLLDILDMANGLYKHF